MIFYRFPGKQILRQRCAFRKCTGACLRSTHGGNEGSRIGQWEEMKCNVVTAKAQADCPLATVSSCGQGVETLYLLPHTTDQSLVIGCFQREDMPLEISSSRQQFPKRDSGESCQSLIFPLVWGMSASVLKGRPKRHSCSIHYRWQLIRLCIKPPRFKS